MKSVCASRCHLLTFNGFLLNNALNYMSHPNSASRNPNDRRIGQKLLSCPKQPHKKKKRESRSYWNIAQEDLSSQNIICFFLFCGLRTSKPNLFRIIFRRPLVKIFASCSKNSPIKFPNCCVISFNKDRVGNSWICTQKFSPLLKFVKNYQMSIKKSGDSIHHSFHINLVIRSEEYLLIFDLYNSYPSI